MATSNFHHIHLHTDTSLLDGFGTCDEYAELAVKNGMKYLCVTDHGMMAAVPQLLDACERNSLEPVIGIEAYLNDYQELVPRFKTLDQATKELVRNSYHILLLAQNTTGYSKLVKLSSEAWEKGMYYKPRMSWKRIAELCSGGDVICTSGCFASEISQALHLNKSDTDDLVKKYIEVFGRDRFFVEWMMINFSGQEDNNPRLISMAERHQLNTLVTNDVHYAAHEDHICQQAQLLMESKNGTFEDPGDSLQYDSEDLWFCTERELDDRWESRYKHVIPEDIYTKSKLTSTEICASCASPDIDTSLKLPELEGADAKFTEMAWAGLKKMGLSGRPEYKMRMEEEIQTICEKGFSSYFLIVKMMIDEAKRVGGLVGPGRGSAVGSLACYCLGITKADPIKHDLLFWRFLSPTRGGRFMKLDI